MKLDPKHLAQLSIILEYGSFQSAADRLRLTQPALSRNMKTLEDRLGSSLFIRDGRRSVPNALAQKLARNGQAIRHAEEQASILAEQSARGLVGELRIGATAVIAGRFLSNKVARFIRENPNCSVELRTGLSFELKEMLERRQVDIVLGPQYSTEETANYDFTPIIENRIGIMCRAGHPLTLQDRLTPLDLKAQAWLTHSRGSLLRQKIETAMRAIGVAPLNIVCEADSIRSVLEIVADTDLITPMPVTTTAPYLEERLVFLDFKHPLLDLPAGFITRKGTRLNPTEEKFIGTFV